MDVEKAGMGDVPSIRELIEHHAGNNKMLSRSLSFLYENIRDYHVACHDGKMVGCCGLHISWNDLAEIKSLAVHPDYMGKGVGKALLDAAMDEARKFHIPRVFTLTLETEFFVNYGFKKVTKDELPMKIWGECIQCPKYPDCDEEALMFELD